MAGSTGEPFDPGAGPSRGGDPLRGRVAEARELLDRTIRETLKRLERDQQAMLAEVRERIDQLADERLGAAAARLRAEHQGEDAAARAAERAETAAARAAERAETAAARAAERAETAAAHAAERAEGAAVQTAERLAGALVEGRGESGRGGRLFGGGGRRRFRQPGAEGSRAEVAAAADRLESAVKRAEDVERRATALEERVSSVERRVIEAAQTAVRAADWERRIQSAAQLEEGAARRIREAERRLIAIAEETAAEDRPNGGGGD